MIEHRRKTGEGLPGDLQLSHTEERAITVWSRVTQTGTDVPEERIQEQRTSYAPDLQNLVAENTKPITAPKEIIENLQTKNSSQTPIINNPTTSNKIMHIFDSKSVGKPINKPFNDPIQNSTNIYENSERIKLDFEKEKLYLQNKELKYKIAKYKYENKDFEFNMDF